MKERPILFNGEMVRAVLDGRKTQTRRVIKKQPGVVGAVSYTCLDWLWHFTSNSGKVGIFKPAYLRCPYGKPGDRLWVRETWHKCSDGSQLQPHFVFRADGDYSVNTYGECIYCEDQMKWKPSIHMPKVASRILLEVTDVRVERVQEIAEGDVYAEGTPGMIGGRYGCKVCNASGWTYTDPDGCKNCKGTGADIVGYFKSLWDSINGKPRKDGVDISWKANPWVWVVTFKRLEAGE